MVHEEEEKFLIPILCSFLLYRILKTSPDGRFFEISSAVITSPATTSISRFGSPALNTFKIALCLCVTEPVDEDKAAAEAAVLAVVVLVAAVVVLAVVALVVVAVVLAAALFAVAPAVFFGNVL